MNSEKKEPRCVQPGEFYSDPEGGDWRDQVLTCGHTMRTWVFLDEETGQGYCGECWTGKLEIDK